MLGCRSLTPASCPQAARFQAHHLAAHAPTFAGESFRGTKRHRIQHDPDAQRCHEPSASRSAAGTAAAAQADPRIAAAAHWRHGMAQGDERWQGQYVHDAQAFLPAQQPDADCVSHTTMDDAPAATHSVGFCGAQSVPEGDVCWMTSQPGCQPAAAQAAACQQQRHCGGRGLDGDWGSHGRIWTPRFSGTGGCGSHQSYAKQEVLTEPLMLGLIS